MKDIWIGQPNEISSRSLAYCEMRSMIEASLQYVTGALGLKPDPNIMTCFLPSVPVKDYKPHKFGIYPANDGGAARKLAEAIILTSLVFNLGRGERNYIIRAWLSLDPNYQDWIINHYGDLFLSPELTGRVRYCPLYTGVPICKEQEPYVIIVRRVMRQYGSVQFIDSKKRSSI